ncbi:hypothetical protein GCM10028812_15600 [Ancylobacter sonchi]
MAAIGKGAAGWPQLPGRCRRSAVRKPLLGSYRETNVTEGAPLDDGRWATTAQSPSLDDGHRKGHRWMAAAAASPLEGCPPRKPLLGGYLPTNVAEKERRWATATERPPLPVGTPPPPSRRWQQGQSSASASSAGDGRISSAGIAATGPDYYSSAACIGSNRLAADDRCPIAGLIGLIGRQSSSSATAPASTPVSRREAIILATSLQYMAQRTGPAGRFHWICPAGRYVFPVGRKN